MSLLEEICDESRFRKCVIGPIVEIRDAVHDSLFTAYHDEPSWGIAHRIMAPLLTPKAVEGSFNGMQETASELVTKWTSSDDGLRINVIDDLSRLNLEATTLCQFGEHLNCLDGPAPPVIKAMDDSTFESMQRPNRPRLLTWLLYQKKYDTDIKTMRDFAREIIAKRRSRSDPPKDMLHALLHAKDPETGTSLTEEQVIDEVVTIFIGATTAPCLLAFTLYYLHQNPQALAKAREEIDNVIGPNNKFTQSHISKLVYCDAIIKESLRLSAVAPGFNIEPLPTPSKEPVTLAGGKYTIPPNQPLIAVLATVNRDPDVFDEPEAFRPERMLPGAFEKLPPGAKKWFGNGKRVCIGRHLAWQWLMVSLVSIVRGVELGMEDQSYELKMDGAYNLKPVGFYVRAGPRR